MKRYIAISLTLFILSSCAQNRNINHFADPVLVRIAEYQDKRQSDSLIQFLHNENPVYRSASALAFASIQDSIASDVLGSMLLEDKDTAVRRNVAFALGQTGGNAAVNALIPAIHDKDHHVVRQVLEALGKTVQKRDLEVLRSYRTTDTLETEGLSWAYYRLVLRNLADSIIALRESDFLDLRFSSLARLGASHFFGRSSFSAANYEKKLMNAALLDPLPEVRMAATLGLKGIETDKALDILKRILLKDKDYRVRVNVIRACAKFSLKESAEIVFGALKDPALAVQISASELILKKAKENPFKRIREEIDAATNFRVKANLYGALLNSIPDDAAISEIIKLYEGSDDYTKAELLTALGSSTGLNEERAFRFLSLELTKSKVPVIKTSAAQAIVELNYHKDFFKKKKTEFIEIYRQGISDGDPAVGGIIAGALADSVLGYKSLIKDRAFLYEAKKRFTLPKDIESLQPLIDAIAYLEGREKPAPLKNTFNHPLDWNIIKRIPTKQLALIKTTKGDIIIRLFVEEAPGSVANFVDLTQQKYFDGKYFHRVVPNFVVQTGCDRGDGFGSKDYSLRSEFSGRRYTAGSIGMASAGKDTEGTQWFITHSPTPHLDGRYTLFAQVSSGQEIVDRIEVGDKIVTVTLIDN